MTSSARDRAIDPGGLLTAVIFAALSVSVVDRFRFGLDRHAVIVPFLKHRLDPGLYPADYLIAEAGHYHTVLWHGLAGVLTATPLEIETLFLGLYVGSIGALFLAVHRLSHALFGNGTAAVFALFLLLFANVETPGAAYLVHQTLIEKTVALPVLLFGLLFFLESRLVATALALGVGFLIHPLTAIYAVAMVGTAAVVDLFFGDGERLAPRDVVVPVLVFAALVAPMLVWRWRSSPGSLGPFEADPEWLSLLRLRSAHHLFPTEWGVEGFIGAAAIAAAFVLGAGWWRRMGVDARRHRVVLSWVAALVAMALVGTVFAEAIPVPIVIQLQFFRGSSFLLLLAILYVAGLLAFAVSRAGGPGSTALALGGALLLLHFSLDARLAWGLLALLFVLQKVGRRLARRPSPTRRGRAGGPATEGDAGWSVAVGVLAAAVLVSGLLVRANDGFVDHPFLEPDGPPGWIDVQRWARDHTAPDALFIVPPDLSGFRILSERSIYGDWKDGTQMFFNPAFGVEWIRRMRALGYDEALAVRGFDGLDRLRGAYDALGAADLVAVRREMRDRHPTTYVVRGRAEDSGGDAIAPDFPMVFEAGAFRVFEVRESTGGPG